MKVVISQPRYLPCLTYLRRLNRADVFVCLDTVRFNARDFENRNRVLLNGAPHMLTIPIKANGLKAVKDVECSTNENWRENHLSLIRTAYKKHEHFNKVMPYVEALVMIEGQNLARYAMAGIEAITRKPVVFASQLIEQPKAGQLHLIEICKKVGAAHYVSGPAGRDYIDPEPWNEAGIEVEYDDAQMHDYPQRGVSGHIPYMAFVDLMFNVGLDAWKEWIK